MGRLAGAERGGGGVPVEPYDLTNGGTVTGDLTLNGHLIMGAGKVVKLDDGAVGAPALAFAADLDNGLYRIGANDWALSAGGVAVQEQIATLVKSLVAHGIIDGAVGAPGLAFTADLDNGLYRTGTNNWSLSAGGTQLAGLTALLISLKINTEMAAAKQLLVDDGTVGAPGLAFRSDVDVGLVRSAINTMQAVAGGVAVEEWAATYVRSLLLQVLKAGAQNLAAATDTITPTTSNWALTNTSGGSLTMTSTPTISVSGLTGGELLVLTNAPSGTNNIVLKDESGAPGSKLRFNGAADKTLSARDPLFLQYNAAAGEWWQISTLQAL